MSFHIEYKAFIIDVGKEIGLPSVEIVRYIEERYIRFLQHLEPEDFQKTVKKQLIDLNHKHIKSLEGYEATLKHLINKRFGATYKEFRPDLKRNWSFKCASCDEKVSSKDGGYYYHGGMTELGEGYGGYFCSKSCVDNMKKDIFEKEGVFLLQMHGYA